jgi:hypothetical protein
VTRAANGLADMPNSISLSNQGDSMRNSHRNKPPEAQLNWLEDYIDALLRTLAQIIGSLLPGRR